MDANEPYCGSRLAIYANQTIVLHALHLYNDAC